MTAEYIYGILGLQTTPHTSIVGLRPTAPEQLWPEDVLLAVDEFTKITSQECHDLRCQALLEDKYRNDTIQRRMRDYFASAFLPSKHPSQVR